MPHTNIWNIFLKSKAIHHKNYKLYLFYDQKTFKALVFFQDRDMSVNSQHSSDNQKQPPDHQVAKALYVYNPNSPDGAHKLPKFPF